MKRNLLPLFIIGAILGSATACGGGGTSSSSGSSSPITMGELFVMSGPAAFVGSLEVSGSQVGMYEVNNNGGVMGHPIRPALQDTAGDPVDAVTAFRQLQTSNPTFEFGPNGSDYVGVIKLIDSAHLPSFLFVGSPALDTMQYQYAYRTIQSDSALTAAMAVEAIKKGYTSASLLFESTATESSNVPFLTNYYTKNGGTILDTESLVPNQTSYRSEIQKAFAGHPQTILWGMDPGTASVVFADMKELGVLNIPMIGTDNGDDPVIAKAIGFDVASKWVTGLNTAPVAGPAYQHFLDDYQAVLGTRQAAHTTPLIYDAVVIAALAMTAAKSLDPTVWNSWIPKVTADETGLVVTNYADGVKALQQGKSIDYEGAGGLEDFNQFHNVFADWEVDQFDSSGTLHALSTITPADVAAFEKAAQ